MNELVNVTEMDVSSTAQVGHFVYRTQYVDDTNTLQIRQQHAVSGSAAMAVHAAARMSAVHSIDAALTQQVCVLTLLSTLQLACLFSQTSVRTGATTMRAQLDAAANSALIDAYLRQNNSLYASLMAQQQMPTTASIVDGDDLHGVALLQVSALTCLATLAMNDDDVRRTVSLFRSFVWCYPGVRM
jgi:hypothetical protein